jgi:leader peptidase (prepilin peptidase) / N-methyltransferase
MIIAYILAFIFGTIIGSFLNVVILRLGTGRGLGGRSACATCAHSLSWYELVPVFSWVLLRGRCRVCRARISRQYPIVEVLMGVAGMYALYHALPVLLFTPVVFFVTFFLTVLVASLLMILVVYDIRHKILPSTILYPLVGLCVASAFVATGGFVMPTLWNALSGVLLSLPLFLLFFFSRGRAIGFADCVLMLGLGYLVPFTSAILGFFLSYWLALAWTLPLLIRGKLTRKSEIPFAPFIILAFVIVYMSGWGIYNLIGLFALY